MVHHRLNEREPNPNSYINFISPLPSADDTEYESARQLLRALAAQVRPIMKSHGFSVNSFEEYEHNNVFAGRNWNAGETIELVLRRPDRTFLPTFWLMSTLCHELAHIKHMHHGPAFQVLWKQLRAEVRALQDKGYYGDGYWSSGTRLADSLKVVGQGVKPGDLPEYMCGGAQTRRRPTVTKARRPRIPRDKVTVASTSTGRQTAVPRKAGGRVKSKTAFLGSGLSLSEGAVESKGKGKGTGFGKQAVSKRAREERALATERRLLALQGKTSTSTPAVNSETETDTDGEGVEAALPETDSDRRESLLNSEKNGDLDDLKSGAMWEYFEKDFNHRKPHSYSSQDPDCGLHMGSSSTGTIGKGKRRQYESDDDIVIVGPPKKAFKALHTDHNMQSSQTNNTDTGAKQPSREISKSRPPPSLLQWSCLICTLDNELQHLACSACGTPRGEETWKQS